MLAISHTTVAYVCEHRRRYTELQWGVPLKTPTACFHAFIWANQLNSRVSMCYLVWFVVLVAIHDAEIAEHKLVINNNWFDAGRDCERASLHAHQSVYHSFERSLSLEQFFHSSFDSVLCRSNTRINKNYEIKWNFLHKILHVNDTNFMFQRTLTSILIG